MPKNKSGGRESRSRDLDHVMGSRFKERTGLDKKWVTEREWQKIMEEKYGIHPRKGKGLK